MPSVMEAAINNPEAINSRLPSPPLNNRLDKIQMSTGTLKTRVSVM